MPNRFPLCSLAFPYGFPGVSLWSIHGLPSSVHLVFPCISARNLGEVPGNTRNPYSPNLLESQGHFQKKQEHTRGPSMQALIKPWKPERNLTKHRTVNLKERFSEDFGVNATCDSFEHFTSSTASLNKIDLRQTVYHSCGFIAPLLAMYVINLLMSPAIRSVMSFAYCAYIYIWHLVS